MPQLFPKPEDGATIYTDLAEELNKSHEILVVSPDQKNKKLIHTNITKKEVLKFLGLEYFHTLM